MNAFEQHMKPMVRIDGARVKELREKQGLTQLYMASVVRVTTETISRWENGRYPSIKGDNGEKLAEALGVELADILEIDTQPEGTVEISPENSPPSSPPPKLALPPKLKRHLSVILMVVLVVVALQVARYFSHSSHQL